MYKIEDLLAHHLGGLPVPGVDGEEAAPSGKHTNWIISLWLVTKNWYYVFTNMTM